MTRRVLYWSNPPSEFVWNGSVLLFRNCKGQTERNRETSQQHLKDFVPVVTTYMLLRATCFSLQLTLGGYHSNFHQDVATYPPVAHAQFLLEFIVDVFFVIRALRTGQTLACDLDTLHTYQIDHVLPVIPFNRVETCLIATHRAHRHIPF